MIDSNMMEFFGLDPVEDLEIICREDCFLDCEAGRHLDPENGVVSKCKSSEECTGWRAYVSRHG